MPHLIISFSGRTGANTEYVPDEPGAAYWDVPADWTTEGDLGAGPSRGSMRQSHLTSPARTGVSRRRDKHGAKRSKGASGVPQETQRTQGGPSEHLVQGMRGGHMGPPAEGGNAAWGLPRQRTQNRSSKQKRQKRGQGAQMDIRDVWEPDPVKEAEEAVSLN